MRTLTRKPIKSDPRLWDKDFLYQQRVVLHKGSRTIARDFGFKHRAVERAFRRYQIPKGKDTGRKWQDSFGHVRVWDPVRKRCIPEHRLIMEQHLGRQLWPTEHVHHINGIPCDNRVDNLEVLSLSEHSRRQQVCMNCKCYKEYIVLRLGSDKS